MLSTRSDDTFDNLNLGVQSTSIIFRAELPLSAHLHSPTYGFVMSLQYTAALQVPSAGVVDSTTTLFVCSTW
jgi:hypothetical protein